MKIELQVEILPKKQNKPKLHVEGVKRGLSWQTSFFYQNIHCSLHKEVLLEAAKNTSKYLRISKCMNCFQDEELKSMFSNHVPIVNGDEEIDCSSYYFLIKPPYKRR